MNSFCFKNSLKKLFCFLFFVFFPIHITYAAWWNPLDWFSGIAEDVFQAFLIAVVAIIDIFVGGIAWLMQQIMWLAIEIMDQSIDHFIYGIKNWIDIGVVDAGWKIMSNVANTFFIFSLLFIAIATILGLNYKQYLMKIVLAAVLVNFSLVFTKAFIDISNVVAVGFYETTKSTTAPLSATKYIETNLDVDTRSGEIASRVAVDEAGLDTTDLLLTRAWNDLVKDMISIFFYLIAAYVFFNFAILLITRFIVLVFLLILSPLAFATFPLPQMKKRVFSKWSEALINQLLIAPVLMFFFYITVLMSGKIFTGPGASVTMLGFMVLVGFLLFSIEATKSLSDSASSMITGGLKRGTGVSMGIGVGASAAAGRNTAGRLGRFAQNRGFGAKMATSDNAFARRIGRATMGSVDKLSSGSWDARNTKLGKASAGKLGITDIYNKKTGFTKLRDQKIDSIATKDTLSLKRLQQQEEIGTNLRKKELELKKKGETLNKRDQKELGRITKKFDGSTKTALDNLNKLATQQKPSLKEVGKSFIDGGISGGIKSVGDKITTQTRREALTKATKGFEKDIKKDKLENFKKEQSQKKIEKEIEMQKQHENLKSTLSTGDAQKIATELSKLTPHEKIAALGESGLANQSAQAHLDQRDLAVLADKMAGGKINLTTNVVQQITATAMNDKVNTNAVKNADFFTDSPKGKLFDLK